VRTIDDLGVDACAHSVQHRFGGAFTGKVDGAGAIKGERDSRLVSGDQRKHNVLNLAAC
jgi:hypothetical protein